MIKFPIGINWNGQNKSNKGEKKKVKQKTTYQSMNGMESK